MNQQCSTINSAINQVLVNSCIRYKGCIIERKSGFFWAMQTPCNSLEAAKGVIDSSFKAIKIG